ncbi:hypothetical protein [Labedella endophytica]|uniref:Septum formation-related domain-containing protein n=1 Tax=Labedella endophytica TaxID=1523160 RepID=A0A433JTR4_9MICO|nr:hypothetical protein [Labedella endophytica]RUR01600.1 hypothetical protein ELQ94_08945 [Labedella endophytica]
MTNGTGGGFPSDGDEPVEGDDRALGGGHDDESRDDPSAGSGDDADDSGFGPDVTTHANTEGIEILDDGADWLATQLAALPADTTDIPIVAAETGDGSDGDSVDDAPEAASTDHDGDSAEDKTAADDAAATRRLPVVPENAPAPSTPAALPAEESTEPPLTRPRAPEPMAGWFAPTPPRPPLPVPAASAPGEDAPSGSDGTDDSVANGTDPSVVAQGSERATVTEAAVEPVSTPETAPELESAPEPASVASSESERTTTDEPQLSEVGDAAPVTPSPVSAAHPNAIVIPGLPKRSAPESEPEREPVDDESTARESDSGERHATSPSTARSAAVDSDVPGDSNTVAAPRPAMPEETGEIDFGSFVWSLVPNREDDPLVVRERQEAEERAAAERETREREAAGRETAARETSARETADREAAERAGVASAATASAAAAVPAVPTPSGAQGPGESSPYDVHADDLGVDDEDTDDSAGDAAPAPVSARSTGDGPVVGQDRSEAPTWSRPDLDDAFPATAAMDVLPADDDPDDPDDELDAADRFSALGTAAMPLSAASAAQGGADHAPTPSAASRADASESVFPDGLVAEGSTTPSDRRSARTPDGHAAGGGTRAARRTTGTNRSLLTLIAAGVVAVLALVGLFYLGTRLPLIFAGSTETAESATPTPSATPEPTAEQPAAGPLAAGTYAWDELQGGECLDPYSSPWAEDFTVVDCAEPHAAQLVFVAPYADDPATPFPGEDVIAAEIGLLCSAPGVVDFGAAAPFTDLQVQGAYPVSGEQWAAGDRDYFCFASRSSGEPLTASVATTP